MRNETASEVPVSYSTFPKASQTIYPDFPMSNNVSKAYNAKLPDYPAGRFSSMISDVKDLVTRVEITGLPSMESWSADCVINEI